MLTDKKEFWNTIRETASQRLQEMSETNLSIVKSERTIEKLLKADKIDTDELENEFNYLSHERCTTSYLLGFQDGAKMLNLMLSGEVVNQMMMVDCVKADPNDINWRKMTGAL